MLRKGKKHIQTFIMHQMTSGQIYLIHLQYLKSHVKPDYRPSNINLSKGLSLIEKK